MSVLEDTTAVILAGGLGTRLRTVVHDRPKVMALVAGRPFMTHLFDQLQAAGIRHAVLCTGYLATTIRDELGNRYRGITLDYSMEEMPLGTGGALRHAASHLRGETILVMNGDSYCYCDLGAFFAGHAASKMRAGMALAEVDDVSRFGAVITDDNGRVHGFTEKGQYDGPGWINAGLYLLNTEIIYSIADGQQVSLEREIIPDLIPPGIFAYRCPGPFIDIGIPEEYLRAQSFFQFSE